MENYIGDKKVMTVAETEFKTPGKADIVKVYFEDGTSEVMPKMRFEMIKKTEVTSASEFQKTINDKVGSYIFSMLHEFGIKMGEVESILNSTSDYVNGAYLKARNIKWGIEHEVLPLLDVNNVLLEDHAKQNNNGTPSTGSGTDSKN